VQNPNFNKVKGIEAIFAIPGEQTVAQLEEKYRADLICEPRHAFTKINEDIYSLAWFIDSKHELLYGTDTHVKVCDTRDYQSHTKHQHEDLNKS
jgi:calcineurin-like phosphoesterase